MGKWQLKYAFLWLMALFLTSIVILSAREKKDCSDSLKRLAETSPKVNLLDASKLGACPICQCEEASRGDGQASGGETAGAQEELNGAEKQGEEKSKSGGSELGDGGNGPPRAVSRGLGGGPSWNLPSTLAPLFPQGLTLDPSKFRLHIKVLTFNRKKSLERCLQSLEAALYDGDTVDLEIIVDHAYDGTQDTWEEEADAQFQQTYEILNQIEAFPWSHGEKRVQYRARNAGLQVQWLEAWWPQSVNDFGFIVEDDTEVSPLYYRLFTHAVKQYYYNESNYNPRVFGLSFQKQWFVAGDETPNNVVWGDAPMLYQLIGTWGQTLFPVPWKQFRIWFDSHRYHSSRGPELKGMVTNWFWLEKRNKIWTPWFIKWVYIHQMYNFYPSAPDYISYAVNHREAGIDFNETQGADSMTLTEKHLNKIDFNWWPTMPMSELKRYDFCFREVRQYAPIKTSEGLKGLLERIHQDKAVALITVPSGDITVIKNWLCHIDGLELKNYILLVSDVEHGAELAVRGNPVYLLDPQQNKAEQEAGSIAWTAGHVKLIATVLGLGYDVLTCASNTIWFGDPFPFLKGKEYDVQGVLNPSSLGGSFLYLRNSPATTAVMQKMMNATEGDRPQEGVGSLFSSVSFHPLETMQPETVKPDLALGDLTAGVVPVVLGRPTASVTKAVDLLRQESLWLLDDTDFVCKKVTCHKKRWLNS